MRQAEVIKNIAEIILQAGIDAAPANYELCHRFVTRSDPLVCAEFEKALAESKFIDAATFQAILEGAGRERGHIDIALHMDNLDKQISTMIGAASTAAGDAATYSASLTKGATNLGALDPTSDAAAIISDLISQTRTMQQRTAALEENLAHASAELTSVRSDLAKAKVEGGTDALTSLPNRRTFDQKLAEAVEEAASTGRPLSLAFGDVDHFKKFNDTWGHKLGDEVLRYVAGTMVKHYGDLGFPARFGGEEFVVLLPKRTTAEAVKISQSFCERLGARALKTRTDGKEIGKITMSLGVATLKPDESPKDFVERADEAMYAAKKAGRNRVMAA